LSKNFASLALGLFMRRSCCSQ